tara:strand:- start:5433 stop:5822 length:390 start_codon:yes stop_codon:yes gene_type:complete
MAKIPDVFTQLSTEWGFNSPHFKSVSNKLPGDILTFIYNGKPRVVMVIGTKRGVSGKFRSSRDNFLISCVDISDLTVPTGIILMTTLYKRTFKCMYHKKSTAFYQVFSKNNIRLFNLNKVSDLKEIYFK